MVSSSEKNSMHSNGSPELTVDVIIGSSEEELSDEVVLNISSGDDAPQTAPTRLRKAKLRTIRYRSQLLEAQNRISREDTDDSETDESDNLEASLATQSDRTLVNSSRIGKTNQVLPMTQN